MPPILVHQCQPCGGYGVQLVGGGGGGGGGGVGVGVGVGVGSVGGLIYELLIHSVSNVKPAFSWFNYDGNRRLNTNTL
jgi:hypothetical protein